LPRLLPWGGRVAVPEGAGAGIRTQRAAVRRPENPDQRQSSELQRHALLPGARHFGGAAGNGVPRRLEQPGIAAGAAGDRAVPGGPDAAAVRAAGGTGLAEVRGAAGLLAAAAVRVPAEHPEDGPARKAEGACQVIDRHGAIAGGGHDAGIPPRTEDGGSAAFHVVAAAWQWAAQARAVKVATGITVVRVFREGIAARRQLEAGFHW